VISEYEQGYLKATSRRSDDVSTIVVGEFDLLVLFQSWDSRCVCISEAKDIRARHAAVICFENRGVSGLRDLHDPIVSRFASEKAGTVHEIRGRSEDLEVVWDLLQAKLEELYVATGRGLRVLVDLSASPRYYALGLIAYGLRCGLIRDIACFYSEAKYQDAQPGIIHSNIFTIGRWEAVPIPGLLGCYAPEKSRHYLVSVGFEGSKTLRDVTHGDPDGITILFPEPGYEAGYIEKTRDTNTRLFKEYGQDESRWIKAHAADAIGAWLGLSQYASQTLEASNVSSLCCGTKPHSLALALHALATSSPTVPYNKPDRHKETRIVPNGVFWRFDIVDLSSIA
jgi:hypothetical protein